RGAHLGVICGGVLLVFEAGDVALAVTAAVVDEPRRAGFPVLGFPSAATDAHCSGPGERGFDSSEYIDEVEEAEPLAGVGVEEVDQLPIGRWSEGIEFLQREHSQ